MAGKVLIAEDNDSIRQLLLILFQKEGYELFTAEDGQEAINLARAVRPDVLILDVMMPKLSGYEVCEAVKSAPELADAYVLFLTSRTGVTAEAAMRNSGGDAVMTKPFNPMELKKKIREVFEAAAASAPARVPRPA